MGLDQLFILCNQIAVHTLGKDSDNEEDYKGDSYAEIENQPAFDAAGEHDSYFHKSPPQTSGFY